MNVFRTIARTLRRAFEGAGAGARWPAAASMVAPARAALAARHQLAARATFLDSNSPSAAAIAFVWQTNLVGDGPSVRSGHPSEAMRRALQDAWGGFYSRCDIDGFDLGMLLGRVVRSLVISGEALVHLQTTQRGELRLRLLSPEQLDASKNVDNLNGGNRIIAGIEFNAAGERTAYWIFPEQPDLWVSMIRPSVRVPSEDILHVFDPKVPGQVRGTSWLAAVATRLVELDKLEDALAARMNAGALFAGFVTDPEGRAFGDAQPAASRSELSLEPGVLRILPPGASIEFPDVPGIEGAPDLLRHMLRSISAGSGIPYELLSGDLSQVNYSSAKLGLEQFKRRCKAIRASLLTARLLEPVWQRFVTLEVLSGRLHAPDFERSAEAFFAMTAMWPEWASLDPRKETEADILAIGAGIKSRHQVIAASGRDPEDVDSELAADSFVPRGTAVPALSNQTAE